MFIKSNFIILFLFFQLLSCSIFQKEKDDSDKKNILALYLLSLNSDPLSKSWTRASKAKVSFIYKSLNTTGTSESPYLLDNIVYYSASNIVWYASTSGSTISTSTCQFKLSGTSTSSSLNLTVQSVTNCSSSFPIVTGNTFGLSYKIISNTITFSADTSTNSAALALYGLTGLTSTISSMSWAYSY